MSIFQPLMLLFVWKHFWQPSPPNCSFLMQTKYASISSSCIFEDVNYPFEDDLYILKLSCVEHRIGPCVKLFTKGHQFDLVCKHSLKVQI